MAMWSINIHRQRTILRIWLEKAVKEKKTQTRLRIKGVHYTDKHMTVKSARYTPLKLAASEILQRTVDDPALDLYAARIVWPKPISLSEGPLLEGGCKKSGGRFL